MPGLFQPFQDDCYAVIFQTADGLAQNGITVRRVEQLENPCRVELDDIGFDQGVAVCVRCVRAVVVEGYSESLSPQKPNKKQQTAIVDGFGFDDLADHVHTGDLMGLAFGDQPLGVIDAGQTTGVDAGIEVEEQEAVAKIGPGGIGHV